MTTANSGYKEKGLLLGPLRPVGGNWACRSVTPVISLSLQASHVLVVVMRLSAPGSPLAPALQQGQSSQKASCSALLVGALGGQTRGRGLPIASLQPLDTSSRPPTCSSPSHLQVCTPACWQWHTCTLGIPCLPGACGPASTWASHHLLLHPEAATTLPHGGLHPALGWGPLLSLSFLRRSPSALGTAERSLYIRGPQTPGDVLVYQSTAC